MRRFIFGLFVVIGVLGAPAAAGAQSSISSSVTLSGIVPEMRFVYINQDGFITKVVGNTSNNITPRVVSLDNKEQPITGAIWQQYNYFMDQHNWHLDAGVSYGVNPVQINTAVSSQNIEISAQPEAGAGNFQLQVGVTPEFG